MKIYEIRMFFFKKYDAPAQVIQGLGQQRCELEVLE